MSFVVDIEPVYSEAENQNIGIDLGLKTLAFMSNREKAESPDYSRLYRKVRKFQR